MGKVVGGPVGCGKDSGVRFGKLMAPSSRTSTLWECQFCTFNSTATINSGEESRERGFLRRRFCGVKETCFSLNCESFRLLAMLQDGRKWHEKNKREAGNQVWSLQNWKISEIIKLIDIRCSFQMELYRLLPFVHDDISNFVRGVDRTAVGLHESRGKSGKQIWEGNKWASVVGIGSWLLGPL